MLESINLSRLAYNLKHGENLAKEAQTALHIRPKKHSPEFIFSCRGAATDDKKLEDLIPLITPTREQAIASKLNCCAVQ